MKFRLIPAICVGFLLGCSAATALGCHVDARFTSEPIPLVDGPFETYGLIGWRDEQARLDNFAIQLSESPEYVGYIFVFNSPDFCGGEAQARAVRAKRYIVEHRGIPWNRVIWKEEGHQPQSYTMLLIMKPGYPLSYHQFTFGQPRDAMYASRNCKARIAQIKRSKW